KANVGDSLKVEIPERKIISVLPLEKGSTALLIGGQHMGETAEIVGIAKASFRKPALLTLKGNGKTFQTVKENVFVIEQVKA
ncbi:MAG: 30S ribosomal protein S4e, partial [Candidatus Diapherotrites archaeon]